MSVDDQCASFDAIGTSRKDTKFTFVGFLLGDAVGNFDGCLDGDCGYKASTVRDLLLKSCAIRN